VPTYSEAFKSKMVQRMPIHAPSGTKIRGGDRITVPYFGTIGELDDITAESDALTPTQLAMTSEQETVNHSGKAIEISNWAQLAAQYADPYGEMARQFMITLARRGDKALLDAAIGATSNPLPASNIADGTGPNGPVSLVYDLMVDARMLWGDEQNDITLLTVHSQVFKNLLKQKDTTGRPLLVLPENGDIPRYCGVPVAVSDRNMVDASGAQPKFKSLILKKGALAFWYSESPSIQTDTDILTDSELAAIHVYWAAHRYKRTPGATRPGVIEIITNG